MAGSQILTDIGKFKVGYDLGQERTGFCGRPLLLVFTSTDDPQLPIIGSYLTDPAVDALMGFFTGIIIDEKAEPTVEKNLRTRNDLKVIIRNLNGGYLGGLSSKFTLDNMVNLLTAVGKDCRPQISPIYSALLEDLNVLNTFIANNQKDKAVRFVGLLEEFEGSSSPVVVAAKAKLGL